MPDNFPAMWRDLETAVHNAWPEVEIARVTDFAKMDWEDLIRRGQEALPIALIHVPEMTESEEWAKDQTWYEGQIGVYYLASDAVDPDVAAYVERKLDAMVSQLKAGVLQGTFTGVQTLPPYRKDVSPDNTANLILSQKLPATAGAVQCQAVVPGDDVAQG